MKKIHYYTNFPTPYQIELANSLIDNKNLSIVFYEGIARDRPSYWNVKIPENCIILGLSNRFRYLDFSIVKFYLKEKPDVILVSSFFLFPSFILYLLSLIFKTKVYFLTETWRENNKLRNNGILEKLVAFFYSKISGILAVNPVAKDQMHSLFPKKNVELLPYPVSHSHIKFNKKNTGIRLIFANRLISFYNPLRALNIFSLFINSGYDGTLYMNSNGDLYESCKLYIQENGLLDKCFFIDDINNWQDLNNVYEKSNIYFFPAIFTNGNLSLLEMMFSGCGIILSENLFDSYLVDNYINGFKCNSDDEFLNALIFYHNNPRILEDHYNYNYSLVKEKFSIEIISEMYTNFFTNA